MPVTLRNPVARTIVYAVGLHHYLLYGAVTTHIIPGFDVALGALVSVGVSYGDMVFQFGGKVENLALINPSTGQPYSIPGVVSFGDPDTTASLVVASAQGTLDTRTETFADQGPSPVLQLGETWFLTTETHIVTAAGAVVTAAAQKTHFTSPDWVTFTVTRSLLAHQGGTIGMLTAQDIESGSLIGGGILFITYTYT